MLLTVQYFLRVGGRLGLANPTPRGPRPRPDRCSPRGCGHRPERWCSSSSRLASMCHPASPGQRWAPRVPVLSGCPGGTAARARRVPVLSGCPGGTAARARRVPVLSGLSRWHRGPARDLRNFDSLLAADLPRKAKSFTITPRPGRRRGTPARTGPSRSPAAACLRHAGTITTLRGGSGAPVRWRRPGRVGRRDRRSSP
jgi:hypothetical protein